MRRSSGRRSDPSIDSGGRAGAAPPCPSPCPRPFRSPMSESQSRNGRNVGTLVEIKGVVIDAVFPEALPEIYNALSISVPGADGGAPGELIAEVQQHLGDDRV